MAKDNFKDDKLCDIIPNLMESVISTKASRSLASKILSEINDEDPSDASKILTENTIHSDKSIKDTKE